MSAGWEQREVSSPHTVVLHGSQLLQIIQVKKIKKYSFRDFWMVGAAVKVELVFTRANQMHPKCKYDY